MAKRTKLCKYARARALNRTRSFQESFPLPLRVVFFETLLLMAQVFAMVSFTISYATLFSFFLNNAHTKSNPIWNGEDGKM